jgi:hypothetical protein
VTLQRIADEAHAQVQQHLDEYGRIPASQWMLKQHTEWRAAWRAWIDAVVDVQDAVSALHH